MNNIKLNFKREIGWAEIIAIIALLISIGPLIINFLDFKGKESKVEVKQEVPKVFVFNDSNDGKQKMFSYNRLSITNLGGKTVTFNGFYPSKELPMLLNVIDGRISNRKVDFSIYPVDFLMEDIKEKPDQIYSLKKTNLEALSLINQAIEPGNTKVFNYGIVFEPFENRQPVSDLLLMNFDMKFSDGYVYSFRQGYPVSEK